MDRPNLRLDLERLVVRGMPPEHARMLGPLVRRELEQLVAHGGVPPHLARGGRIPAPPAVRAAPGEAPDAVASRVARAVYGAMGGGRSDRAQR